MKKAKTILTAIGVLAVVGGALAIKANTLAQRDVYCVSQGACITTNYKRVPPGNPSTTRPCANETFYYTDDACNFTATGTVYFTNVL